FWRERRGFEGIYTAQKALLTGAYAMKLSKVTNQMVVFGLQGGIVQNQIKGDNLTWGSQFNRYIGFDNSLGGEVVGSEAIIYPTFNFGVIYSSFDNNNYYVRDRSILFGISVDNLNEPTIDQPGVGIATRSRLFRAFGSAKFEVAPRLSVYPSGYLLYSDGNEQVNVGLYFSTLISAPRAFNSVVIQAGTWYRLDDSLIFLGGFQINDIRIGISADLNTTSFDINEALGSSLPSYEISLTYNLDLSNPLGNVSSPIF
ncbi:MAG: PorP/SprF family type IX secretion system membrane protein, partial [Bacteroidota bacterium]